ncbi:MAG: hypothetical protein QOK42_2507 [Frankiaceae bacterium]|nr:hypothetical protein [Frankiaceae bacterium]
MSLPGYIPSPSNGVWHLGPFPLRAYALCIVVGVIVAVFIGERRWVARGGRPGLVGDVSTWAVPFGVIGGRIYHVITSPQAYFGHDGDPVAALYIWKGGLGIWGSIAFGALGAWIGCRRAGVPLAAFVDAVAPGIAVAQAIGRFGNWFNQELYGRATTLPWGLKIDQAHRPDSSLDKATYHPTFLYEALWDLGVAGLVVWADRRWKLGRGRAFAVYVLGYVVGRAWIEALRVDPANRILGLRLNEWTCLVVGLGALAFLIRRRGAGREDPSELLPREVGAEPADAPEPQQI